MQLAIVSDSASSPAQDTETMQGTSRLLVGAADRATGQHATASPYLVVDPCRRQRRADGDHLAVDTLVRDRIMRDHQRRRRAATGWQRELAGAMVSSRRHRATSRTVMRIAKVVGKCRCRECIRRWSASAMCSACRRA